MAKSLVHINNNLMCGIDTETTGDIPGYHEIFQVSLIPLDSYLDPHKEHTIFDMVMRPEYPNRIDYQAIRYTKADFQKIMDTGFTHERGIELFEHWFNTLKLCLQRRIVPLGYNYAQFDCAFMCNWLSHSLYRQWFSHQIRDVYNLVLYLNDLASFHACEPPFTGMLKQSQIATQCGLEIETNRFHDSMYDAYVSTLIYKKLMNNIMLEETGVLRYDTDRSGNTKTTIVGKFSNQAIQPKPTQPE